MPGMPVLGSDNVVAVTGTKDDRSALPTSFFKVATRLGSSVLLSPSLCWSG